MEKNLIELRNQIDRLRTDNDSRFRAQNEKFETEVTNRNKEISELRTKLEATETGGLHLSAYGVVWIFYRCNYEHLICGACLAPTVKVRRAA